MAAVIEQSFDDYGPIWPIAIAPFEVQLCALNANDEGVRATAEKIYAELSEAGLEVLYDDRNEKAGFAFSDADLIGVPFRLILSPKTLAEQVVELKTRDKSLQERVAIKDVCSRVKELVRASLGNEK